MDICSTERAPRMYRTEEHYVACHLYNADNIQQEG